VKRNQIIVLASFLGGLVLICGLSYQFLFQSIRSDIKIQQEKLTKAINDLEDAKAKETQHEKFMAEMENVKRGANFVAARLDSSLSFQEVYETFWRLNKGMKYKEYEIKMDSKIAPSKEDAGYSYMEVKTTFETDYHSVGLFINQIISQKRMVNLTEIKLESFDPTGVKGTVKASLTFRLYLKTPSA
jgi:Tfp pilus assembly protein PilO